jgi:Mechanosensitive ion channel, conserved TM helix
MWQTLRSVLGEAWQQFAVQVMHVLPNVLASLLILATGILLAIVAGRVALWLLMAAQVDRAAARLGVASFLERLGISSVTQLLARLLTWGIVLLAFIPALFSLDARLASDLLSRFLLYLPHVIVAIALLIVGALLSRFTARSVLIAAVNHEMGSAQLLSAATRAGIMLVTIGVALEQLGIGLVTVQIAFAILFGGVTLALALALGLGSQEIVRRWLAKHFEPGEKRGDEGGVRHW